MSYIVSLAELRAAGITEAMLADDPAQDALDDWEAWLEDWTEQFFEPRAGTLQLDGSGSDTLFLPVPIITLSSLFINDSTAALDSDYYHAYTNRTKLRDDRRNPKIRLKSGRNRRDIFSRPGEVDLVFREGTANQKIVGTFGFVEEDGVSPPRLLKRAILRIMAEKLGRPIVGNPPAGATVPPVLGALIEEETDDHRMKWAAQQVKPVHGGSLADVVADPEARGIIRRFKRPIALAAPGDWSWT